ncbi:MAG: response regulator [Chloroflexota bacterium]|nr:MAG: response regulator [Chloroflexota bacterium]
MTRILLVEDDEMNRDMLSRRLMRKGFEVSAGVDGQEGVDMALSEKPDLIILDIGLPVMDGWQVARILKSNPATQNIPIIALTAHTMAGDREKALEAGSHDYDTKPVVFSRLMGKIQRLLGESEESEEVVDTGTDESLTSKESKTGLAFAAVLFTDIVNSTVEQQVLGNRSWVDLIERLNNEMVHLSVAQDGKVVKSTGDGILAVFPTPSGALTAAADMVAAAEALGLGLRVGVHAGEILEIEGDYLGTVVTIASRVTDQAGPGEILTTSVVKGLVEGSGYEFAGENTFDLKGIGPRSLVRLVARND